MLDWYYIFLLPGAVTACIDPNNTFMEHRLTFPKLLDQCAQGWVNNVLLTGAVTQQTKQLTDVQTLVRSVNPDVALLLAIKADVTR